MKWIKAVDLIPMLEKIVAESGPEVGIEINIVGNLLVTDEKRKLGYIDLSQKTYEKLL